MPRKAHEEKGIRAELAAEIGYALRQIDRRLNTADFKDRLVIHEPGRKVPHYPFLPSLLHPDPWGVENYKSNMVHKKVGKKSGAKRGRK